MSKHPEMPKFCPCRHLKIKGIPNKIKRGNIYSLECLKPLRAGRTNWEQKMISALQLTMIRTLAAAPTLIGCLCLEPKDFPDQQYRLLFSGIRYLHDQGKTVNTETLSDLLDVLEFPIPMNLKTILSGGTNRPRVRPRGPALRPLN